jgi:K+-sensing histidine kinase KdpD
VGAKCPPPAVLGRRRVGGDIAGEAGCRLRLCRVARQVVGRGRAAFGSIDRQRGDLATPLKVTALVSAALLAVDIVSDIPHYIFAYLVPIAYVATKFGRIPAVIATAVSGLCAAYFLYEPLLSLEIEENLDTVEVVSFCVGALMIIQLLGKRSDYGLMRQP